MLVIARLDLSWKMLSTMFLIVLSCGFFVAHLYLHHMVGGAAGKGESLFPSLQDISAHFHGRPGESRLMSMSLGSMKKYFSDLNDPDKLTPAEQAELDAVVKWCENQAPENQYWDKDHKPGPILKIFENRCLECHKPGGKMKKSPLDTYAATMRFTKQSGGLDTGHLLMLSHVHLLGMGLMFLGVGLFMAATRYGSKLRAALIFGGFCSILLDIGGWWATKWWGMAGAPVTLAGGMLMGLSFGLIVLFVLYDIWLAKEPTTAED